jgi:hypothetical protein
MTARPRPGRPEAGLEIKMDEIYMKEGEMGGTIGGVIGLIVGVGIAVLVLVFVGVLGGQTWQQTEADIDAITNTTVKGHIKNAAINGFDALEKTGAYLPLIVLALVIGVVLSVVLGFMSFGGRGGSAL